MPKVVYLSAANSLVTASPATIANDGVESATITVVVRNTDGNPFPNRAVTLAFVSGTGTLTQPVGTTNSEGVITGSVVSSTLGTMVIKATVLGVDITDTVSVAVSGTAPLYPNQPGGFTNLVDWDGSPRGTTDAFGVADFGAWSVDAAAPASNLEVVADATNPVGSGNVLKLIWSNTYNPRAGQATANPLGTGDYSEIYVGFYVKWVDLISSKIFYFGTPSVAGSEFWLERGDGGRMRLITQGFVGQAEVLDTNDAAPKGTGGVSPLPDADTWYFIELHCIAESTPGAADGYARAWVDGAVVGTSTTVLWGTGTFGSIEWYADNNGLPTAADYEQRLGGLRIAGKA